MKGIIQQEVSILANVILNPSEKYGRQSALVDPKELEKLKVTFIGTGSIGSFAAAALARMGILKFELWDDDKVDVVNLSNQDFPEAALGQYKVEALKERLLSIESKAVVVVHPERWEGQSLFSGIVVSSVDNLPTRRKIWQEGIKMNPRVPIFIDPRMGALYGNVYCINPSNTNYFKPYEEELTDVGVQELPCTGRTIVFNVVGLASIIGAHVVRYVKREPILYEVRADFHNLEWKSRALPLKVV